MRRRTTTKEFSAFKEEFLHWQMLLGLGEYEITFSRRPLENAYAQTETDGQECVAWVTFAERIPDGVEFCVEAARSTGKHEAMHLLTARMRWLAMQRFTNEDAIAHEDERIVRVLEKIL